LLTVGWLTPISAAIARSDFSGCASTASLARTAFGTYGFPQLHDALASAPQLVQTMRGIETLMTAGFTSRI
jgi:hypothetical protein